MRRKGPIIAAILACAALAFGLLHIFSIRFSIGDIYPAYSSLRADPLGTRALYESIVHLRGVEAERSFQPLDRMEGAEHVTLLFTGLRISALDRNATNFPKRLIEFAEQGARVVIGLDARDTGMNEIHEYQDGTRPGERPAEPETKAMDAEPDAPSDTVASWLNELYVLPHEEPLAPDELQARRTDGAARELPETVAWPGLWQVERANDEWAVVYERKEAAVVLERAYGAGSIVFCSDSYLLSNEALWRDREPEFLNWLIGEADQVRFVETHHGLSERIGVMTLIRAFRLHGVLAGLVVLAVLFVWRQNAPLIPPDTRTKGGEPEEEVIMGRDVHSGMIALLKRAVPRRALLATCVDLWAAEHRTPDGADTDEAQRVRNHLAQYSESDVKNPVPLYRTIGRIIKERKSP